MDDDLNTLRHEAEREALTVALGMLRNPATPATARASVVRGLLADAAARRNDESVAQKAVSDMSYAELQQALHQNERRLAHLLADDAEVEEVAPADRSVFD